ncbi:MAG TPA: hypothetical protein VGO11_01745 [Chthoniobacteraceae bacterium]|jgi:hypothetical protein|nr:hypothetical protein [Chthoniobacteraceae bacterium]
MSHLSHLTRWGLCTTAAAIPLSLLWDFSWEATVGIDNVWAAPHLTGYLAVAVAALIACLLLVRRIGAPLGARIVLWGAVAFLAAMLLDRWWLTAYGLAAGIWHPPQLLKATAFFAVIAGGWLACEGRAFVATAGALLSMIGVVTLASNFANRQHSAAFYQIACGTYPFVLAAVAAAAPGRWAATRAALVYTLLWGAAVWLLPLIPGRPLVAPILHPRDHLLPPPFPLLLLVPAAAMDCLLAHAKRSAAPRAGWGDALEAGGAFALSFLAAQWLFASFLLSPATDNWFFAGGGRHWPFFLQITPAAETSFWHSANEALRLDRALVAVLLAIASTFLGLRLGAWMKGVRR